MAGNPFRILIVDDESEIHAILGKALSKNGYLIENAYSAKEAIKLIDKATPDLVILDLMMPEISGIELLKMIRSNDKTKDVLVLILSARDAQTDRLEGLAKGADDYEVKPFHLKSLVRKVEHMLQKKVLENFEKEIRN